VSGRVYLVGAGPGDPGLLTVRARELLDQADVVLTDRLVPPGVLDGLRAEVIDVGKVGGGEQVPQEETNRLMVEHAQAGA
jgi:uroporphyrinogen III methyltransferase/synthase